MISTAASCSERPCSVDFSSNWLLHLTLVSLSQGTHARGCLRTPLFGCTAWGCSPISIAPQAQEFPSPGAEEPNIPWNCHPLPQHPNQPFSTPLGRAASFGTTPVHIRKQGEYLISFLTHCGPLRHKGPGGCAKGGHLHSEISRHQGHGKRFLEQLKCQGGSSQLLLPSPTSTCFPCQGGASHWVPRPASPVWMLPIWDAAMGCCPQGPQPVP